MQVIKTFTELMGLNLPSSDKADLIGHLTEATDGDLNELEKSWDEIGITLILFDESDTNQDLDDIDEQTKYLIDLVINHPEYVLLIGSMVIALGVLNDNGSGCFLAGYTSTQLHPIQTLLTQVDGE
ncbi:hypothetical protein [Vibrio splendidus]|uniref:hypothetical protein n=1 Tax=Vibrio splendidus TaxID=29497 RepID=UPI000C82A1C8|nr:hypothetical protein [Vibrio splendidus]PMI63185.1 hypothetical protein BCU63_21600 [Vibrio splendidus]PMJ45102.1 hypothetical protein BCU23_26140 [Vibrio splendidus]